MKCWTRLQEKIVDLLIKCDWKVVEFNGEEDNVHLLFQYHLDLQLSTLVNNVKSIASRKLRQEFSEHLSKIYCQDVFGNGSYFIASCGGVPITTLKQYIENQDRPLSSVEIVDNL